MDLRFYRLDPAEDYIFHAHWNSSKIRETCWVRAASEREARMIASIRLTGPLSSKQGYPSEPWLNKLLVRCSCEVPPLELGNRSLITQSGVTYL